MKLIAKFAQGASLFSLLVVSGLVQAATTEQAAKGAAVEEIVVTGSYIKGSAENTALPIDVVTNQELQDVGNPSMIEFIRTLGITSGNLGETNQFNAPAQGTYGVTTINLRGLGSARTLTLINGHRQVATEDFGVDVAAFPMNAFGRTEILKDGAAALYGSDAIAGVVNFITREGFEGVEITGSNQWIDHSSGNQNMGLLMGWSGDDGRMDAFVALEFDHRSRLNIRNKSWGLKPFDQNANGGWSTTGMPGTTYLYNPNVSLAPGTLPGTNQNQYRSIDPQCANLGASTYLGTCDFQFTYFDSLIEDTKQYKSYAEFNYQVNDNLKWHSEVMYSRMDMPDWQSSPAYPPNSLFGPDRIVPADNPGLQQYKADYPGVFACVATNTCSATVPLPAGTTIDNVEVYQRSRMLGVQGRNGKALRAAFQTNTWRLATSLSGEFGSIGWDAAVSWSHRERLTSGYDMQVQGMAFALNGLGGPGCDPQTGTPGVGPCMYYNPFSEAVPYSVMGFAYGVSGVNDTYCGSRDGLPGTPGSGLGAPCLAGTTNPQSLIDWLTLKGESNTKNELVVWDFVLNGDTGIKLPGGTIGWAAGVQARNEKYKLHLNDVANINVEPCPWTDPAAVTFGFTTPDQLNGNCTVKFGLLAFGVPGTPTNDTRNIYAAFSEFQLPITDTLNGQFAVRYEDYGPTGGGSTIDPKIALKWQAVDWLALRGSISTTFRGPPQSYLSGVNTYLQNIPAINAYRAVNINGNPDLEPETAVASNVGVIFELGGFYASVDYWNYKFSKPFQIESATQIIGAYAANGCQGDGSLTNPYGPGVGTPVCDQDLRPRFVPNGTQANQLASVDIYWINGSDINTNGLDFLAQYDFDSLGGQMTVGLQGTYTMEYTSDDFRDKYGLTLAPGGDFAGWMNIGVNPFYPLPDLKGNAFVRYTRNNLRLSYVWRYVNDYRDAAPTGVYCSAVINNCYLQHVQNWITQDVTAIYTWKDLTISASVFNLTDEDPPEVWQAQNYDAYTHDPIGRNYKLQLTYTFGGGG